MKLKTDIQKGDKFGRWVVLEPNVYNPNSTAKTKIRCSLCQCSCEKKTVKYIQNANLRKGASLSCGCLRGEQLAIKNAESSSVKIGNKYGKLTVIDDLGMRLQPSRNKHERWSLCQCDCGSEPIEVKNNMLQNGWKKSCGCMGSFGEVIVETILQQNNIQYIKEYSFSDLLSANGHPLRFDFAIFENQELKYLIEFDGRQHYTGPEAKWSHSASLEDIQQRDELKNNYCKNNNIQLKRIPFFDISNITYEKIISNDYNI